ncbi:STX18 [Mytilus coruscus]|uniref:STX18 n=1 Tax=Mytilus coruscus TaxID=42192 RepID=A0A6J8CLD9_MYTCO|nr:STX18 [Mytilus coruscus]
MSDVTNLFKATVKTIKSRNKISKENGKKEMTNIFPVTKQRSDFENTAKGLVSTITQLKDFLLKHRKDYVNAGSFLSSDVSSLTDTERDQIDTEAQTVIKKCQQTIVMFKKDAHHQIVHPQVKEHRDHVIRIIEDYLKVVCKVYSEQKAVRVKRVVDKKRIPLLKDSDEEDCCLNRKKYRGNLNSQSYVLADLLAIVQLINNCCLFTCTYSPSSDCASSSEGTQRSRH